jgi:hypothetical protein
VDIVPKTVVNMGGSGAEAGNTSNTVMDTLLKFITLDKLGVNLDKSLEEVAEPQPIRKVAVEEVAAATEVKGAESQE